MKDRKMICALKIPNEEVKYIFEDLFLKWTKKGIGSNEDVKTLIKAMLSSDVYTFEELLNKLMINSLSYYDTAQPDPEKVYHAFVVGLLVNMSSNYIVKSNPESGYGRVDVMIIPKERKKTGVIIEFKVWKKQREKTIECSFEKAKNQIIEKKYEQNLKQFGANPIIKYIGVFDGKRVFLKKLELNTEAVMPS